MSQSASSEGGWITTFADLMTLLFCFFVLLTTLSTQPKNCSDLELYLKNYKKKFAKYELRSTKLSCIISLPQDFLFSSGDAVLKKGAFKELSPLFFKILEIQCAAKNSPATGSSVLHGRQPLQTCLSGRSNILKNLSQLPVMLTPAPKPITLT